MILEGNFEKHHLKSYFLDGTILNEDSFGIFHVFQVLRWPYLILEKELQNKKFDRRNATPPKVFWQNYSRHPPKWKQCWLFWRFWHFARAIVETSRDLNTVKNAHCSSFNRLPETILSKSLGVVAFRLTNFSLLIIFQLSTSKRKKRQSRSPHYLVCPG